MTGSARFACLQFQRNYRACVRSHKTALMAQRRFWGALLRDAVPFADLLKAVDVMQRSEAQAQQVYRRCERTGLRR